MKKQLEKYFGCKVKIAEYKNKLPLPIFMTIVEDRSMCYIKTESCDDNVMVTGLWL